MGLKARLYYKCVNYVKSINHQKLKSQLGIDSSKLTQFDYLQTAATLQSYQDKFDVLIDVGANKGAWAQTCDAVFNFSKIVCFEPNEVYGNTIKNNIGSKLLLINKVATDTVKKEGEFFVHHDPTMSSAIVSDEQVLSDHFPYDHGEIKRIKREWTTIDESLKDTVVDNQRVLMKIDTQGNELDVLKGAEDLLANNIDLCIVEHMFFTPYNMKYDFQDLLTFMTERNFELVGCVNTIKRDNHVICDGDFLFKKISN